MNQTHVKVQFVKHSVQYSSALTCLWALSKITLFNPSSLHHLLQLHAFIYGKYGFRISALDMLFTRKQSSHCVLQVALS